MPSLPSPPALGSGGFRIDFTDPFAFRLEEGVRLGLEPGTITEVVHAVCAPSGA